MSFHFGDVWPAQTGCTKKGSAGGPKSVGSDTTFHVWDHVFDLRPVALLRVSPCLSAGLPASGDASTPAVRTIDGRPDGHRTLEVAARTAGR